MIHSFVNAFFKEEDGQDLVEYSLLLAFIAIAAVAVLKSTSVAIKGVYTAVNSSLTVAAAS
jgi:Flp pilus assembly pilin Flp